MEFDKQSNAQITDDIVAAIAQDADDLIASGKLGGRPRPKNDLIRKLAPTIRKLRENDAPWIKIEAILRKRGINVTRKTIRTVMSEIDGTTSELSRGTVAGPIGASRANSSATSSGTRKRSSHTAPQEPPKKPGRKRRAAHAENPTGLNDGSSSGRSRGLPDNPNGTSTGSGGLPTGSADGTAARTDSSSRSGANGTTSGNTPGTQDGTTPDTRANRNGRSNATSGNDQSSYSSAERQPTLALDNDNPTIEQTRSFESTRRNFG